MTNGGVTNGNVCNLTDGTDALTAVPLVLGCEQHTEPILAEASPGILGDIAFEQYPLSILELQQVLHDEGIVSRAAHESGLAFQPGERLEKVVSSNFDVGRGDG